MKNIVFLLAGLAFTTTTWAEWQDTPRAPAYVGSVLAAQAQVTAASSSTAGKTVVTFTISGMGGPFQFDYGDATPATPLGNLEANVPITLSHTYSYTATNSVPQVYTAKLLHDTMEVTADITVKPTTARDALTCDEANRRLMADEKGMTAAIRDKACVGYTFR
ncbi:MAG: hypothetical protein WAX89_04225 [Alphaproteobacteria bacterium]